MKKIAITGIRGMGKFILVDNDDFPLLSRYRWHFGSDAVAFTRIAGRKDKMPVHRLIMNPRKDLEVDHINGNKLDNQKSNLRICTHGQNGKNHKLNKNNTSGYKGVSWSKTRKKWESYIKVNYKRIKLGFYDDKKQAALAYNTAAQKHFKEFANLNVIKP
jgi:hypothetical protein